MRKSLSLALVFLITHTLFAQDEGNIVKRERIARSQGVFVALGPSVTLGKNIGDYKTGFNFEVGTFKRLNRILSIGPSLSFVQFKYDSKVTSVGDKNVYIGGPYTDNNGDQYYQALGFALKGGDITLVSLAANIKLNLIPVKDNSLFSVYGFIKPFVSSSTRTAVTGPATLLYNYDDLTVSADWKLQDRFDWASGSTYAKTTYGIDVTQDLKKESKITGGMFVGPGVEVFPAKAFSAFFQVAVGYTFPLTYISTEAYNTSGNQNNLDTFLSTKNVNKYPMVKKGFPSVSFQIGASYNF